MEGQLTFSELVKFNNAARGYMGTSPKNSTLTFALQKLLGFYEKKIDKIQKEWQQEVNEACDEIRVKWCEKDADGVFKEKTYGEGKDMVVKKVFKADNELKCNKEIATKVAELETKFMATVIEEKKTHFVEAPKSLELFLLEAFEGFVIKPMTDEAKLEHHLAQDVKDK